ncbi:MAG TPA: CBS domain-containing protein [Jatrophihabitans sp.]|jgi:CBS domain-containing protein
MLELDHHVSRRADQAVVADAMLTIAETATRATRVGEVRATFADDHRHAVVVLDGTVVLTVLDRGDLIAELGDDDRVGRLGTLADRVVAPHAPLEATRQRMIATRRRRLAVVDSDGTYRGLLCLKSAGTGFCSDDDVRARAAEL